MAYSAAPEAVRQEVLDRALHQELRCGGLKSPSAYVTKAIRTCMENRRQDREQRDREPDAWGGPLTMSCFGGRQVQMQSIEQMRV
jgi:hypothetical protein